MIAVISGTVLLSAALQRLHTAAEPLWHSEASANHWSWLVPSWGTGRSKVKHARLDAQFQHAERTALQR
jgi:hypothetical protein